MGREGEIVNPACFQFDLAVGDHLRPIHQQACPIAMHDMTDLRQIVEDAQDIRGSAHGHHLDALVSMLTLLVVFAQERVQHVYIHKAFSVHWHPDQRNARNHPPRQLVRVVFHERVQHDGFGPRLRTSWRKLSVARLIASVVLDVKITS